MNTSPPNDFYGQDTRPYCAARRPEEIGDRLVPKPARASFGEPAGGGRATVELSRSDTIAVSIPKLTTVALESFLAHRLDAQHGVSVALVDEESARTRFELEARDAIAAGEARHPAPDESYRLRSDERGATVRATTELGLLRGAATLAQLVSRTENGRVDVPLVDIDDAPAIPRRILGGWALARGERLREAIDLAAQFKANRVLYNAWGWVPGERLTTEDAHFVRYARARGVELIFELRRMSFGDATSLREPELRDEIIAVFREAAEIGFRAFGFLFDDVAWETPSDECTLVRAIDEMLRHRLGEAPELYACPQHYWYPGQMALDWTGPAEPEERTRQRDYLATWGRNLPRGTHVYLANFWGDVPTDYADDLRTKYSQLVGRRPVFFDNQLINDYRLGAAYPFALQQRPTDFAEHVDGYLINAPRPLIAYAASVGTALAYAWNPADYDPASVLGAAIELTFHEAAEAYSRALESLRDLANEWAGGRYTAADHYRTIWRGVRRGDVDAARIDDWVRRARRLEDEWLTAIRSLGPRRVSALRGLGATLASARRLRSDLDLFRAYFEARAAAPLDASSRARLRATAAAVRRTALDFAADLLPPLPHTAILVDAADGSREPDPPPRGASQGWSWVEYFYRWTERAIDEVTAEMESELDEHRPATGPEPQTHQARISPRRRDR